ncbi:TPMT family class I SAM-dependent methyltransferase [Psychrobacter cibarius]|uniref:TPMT family class I SAM-dependent methyltransferase n=1 Tax=Psychrobacter cibarius TaxID=282669 RepID=UPI002234203A|nr:TPMT family class I SAM-dependent methyltransferase [Psychrobacter cibarius]
MENVNQAEFWQQRYEQDSIGWDMGQVSPPLKAYIDQLPESAKEQAILVPGAGNAYEVGYLHEQGLPMSPWLILPQRRLQRLLSVILTFQLSI